MDRAGLAAAFGRARPQLGAYLARLAARPALAEELLQGTYVKALEALERCPGDEEGVRRWLFRIATNLALDELRRHSQWRETAVQDLREAAEGDPAFVRRSQELAGAPETAAIAREHLAACFSCTLRSFPPHKACALLLKEVYGFSLEEIAEFMADSTAVQVKNWLQETRAAIDARYGRTCALVAKQGICHQCTELADFFGSPAKPRTPLALADRLAELRALAAKSPGEWHRMLFALIDDDGTVHRATK